MNLDHDLRRAFRRTPAPDDLASKVLARIAEGDVRDANATAKAGLPRRSRFAAKAGWLAAAAVLALMAGGARYYLHQQAAAEAERVQADIMVAFQITEEKIALVQRKVEDSQR
jgi:hypothetical protein